MGLLLLQLTAYQLEAPYLLYSSSAKEGQVRTKAVNTRTKETGNWNMAGKEWLFGRPFECSAVIDFAPDASQVGSHNPWYMLSLLVDRFKDSVRGKQMPMSIKYREPWELVQCVDVMECKQLVMCIWPYGTEDPKSKCPEQPSRHAHLTCVHVVLPARDVVFDSAASWKEAVAKVKAHRLDLSSWGAVCFASSDEVKQCVSLFDETKANARLISTLMDNVSNTGVRPVGSPVYVSTVLSHPTDHEVRSLMDQAVSALSKCLVNLVSSFEIDSGAQHAPASVDYFQLTDLDLRDNEIGCMHFLCIWPHGTDDPSAKLMAALPADADLSEFELFKFCHLILPAPGNHYRSTESWKRVTTEDAAHTGDAWAVRCFASEALRQ